MKIKSFDILKQKQRNDLLCKSDIIPAAFFTLGSIVYEQPVAWRRTPTDCIYNSAFQNVEVLSQKRAKMKRMKQKHATVKEAINRLSH